MALPDDGKMGILSASCFQIIVSKRKGPAFVAEGHNN